MHAYKKQRNHTVSLRRNAIVSYLKSRTDKNVTKPSEFWKTFKPFTHSKTQDLNVKVNLTEKRSLIKDKTQVEEILNEYFVSSSLVVSGVT